MGEAVYPPTQGWILNRLGRPSRKHFARQIEIADQAIEVIEKEFELSKRIGGLLNLVPGHSHREGPAAELLPGRGEIGEDEESRGGLRP